MYPGLFVDKRSGYEIKLFKKHISKCQTHKPVFNFLKPNWLFPRDSQWRSVNICHVHSFMSFTATSLTINLFPHSLHKLFALFLPTVHLSIRRFKCFNLFKAHSMPDTNSFNCFCPFCRIIKKTMHE